ncbi:hypothetical protein DV532_25290 (plasmid) [Pseudomonas sp. Leaf58]|uniref:hypothetical protein n=1 Tax=unclassified Pseudomonas TaxID=196821 RepID=UPI0006FA3E9C|nr:hypothetical protein [Pseudomonas sp. Leaf58]AYG47616.1 hypothetical protein DV532_25290 [Pseudomonas sp. Leaf58]KQN62821.1 hypothetical protein ASF02_11805 [Pseudomonas sp. Leaf58]
MVHLIVVIMAIVLMSYMLVSGISYTNPEVHDAREKVEHWSVQNMALSAAWSKYRLLYGRNPSTPEQLSSELALPLVVPDGLTLSRLTSAFSGWCFAGEVSGSGLAALKSISTRFPTQYGLSDQCGYEGGISPSWAPALDGPEPVPVVLTFKFSR